MSKSQHRHDSMQLTQNQKNEMSDDPRDGARNSETVGRDGPPTPVERSPEEKAQDESAVAFGRKGAGAGSA